MAAVVGCGSLSFSNRYSGAIPSATVSKAASKEVLLLRLPALEVSANDDEASPLLLVVSPLCAQPFCRRGFGLNGGFCGSRCSYVGNCSAAEEEYFGVGEEDCVPFDLRNRSV